MKKLLALAIATISLSACNMAQYGPYYKQEISVGDLSKHTKEGFTISTSTAGFNNYMPIALVSIDFIPGIVKGTEKEKITVIKSNEPMYGDRASKRVAGKYYSPTWDDRVNELVKVAKEKGANCILDLKMTSGKTMDKGVERFTYTISGFAVIIPE